MKKSSHIIYWLTITTALLISAAVFYGYIFFWRQLEGLRSRIQSIKSEITMAITQQERSKELARILKIRDHDISRFKNVYIDGIRPIQFIEAVESLAEKNDVRVVLNIVEQKKTEHRIVFNLDIDGSETTVRRFVRLLELMPYLVTVKSAQLEITAGKANASSAKMLAVIHVATNPLQK